MTGTITGAITGAVTSPYCFVAGTTVLTAAGAVAIEQIQAGDQVWAWDEETGTVGIKKVVETYVNETDELVHVFVNQEEIVATPRHPFYSPVKGWTEAALLRAGDILVLVNGEYIVVEKIQHEILEAPVAVYNFQVEDYHAYYVTDAGVLVHNTCKKYYKATRSDDGIKVGNQLSESQALNRLRNGKDVYANSRSAAKSLAKRAYGNSRVFDEIHEYLFRPKWHFHDRIHHSYHIFFD